MCSNHRETSKLEVRGIRYVGPHFPGTRTIKVCSRPFALQLRSKILFHDVPGISAAALFWQEHLGPNTLFKDARINKFPEDSLSCVSLWVTEVGKIESRLFTLAQVVVRVIGCFGVTIVLGAEHGAVQPPFLQCNACDFLAFLPPRSLARFCRFPREVETTLFR